MPTCAEEGVLGVVPGIVGLHQATETIKLLTGVGTSLAGTLLMLDLLANETQYIGVRRRETCVACGSGRPPLSSSSHNDTDGDASSPTPRLMTDQPSSFTPGVLQMSPQTLATRMSDATPPVILDVREAWEYDIVHLTPSVLIPLSELQARASSLQKDAEYVVLCHHGMRSEMAAEWLRAQGFARVANLDGGIDRYSAVIDSALARY